MRGNLPTLPQAAPSGTGSDLQSSQVLSMCSLEIERCSFMCKYFEGKEQELVTTQHSKKIKRWAKTCSHVTDWNRWQCTITPDWRNAWSKSWCRRYRNASVPAKGLMLEVFQCLWLCYLTSRFTILETSLSKKTDLSRAQGISGSSSLINDKVSRSVGPQSGSSPKSV